jgi:tetratricopeptide (TPR) repeat protein
VANKKSKCTREIFYYHIIFLITTIANTQPANNSIQKGNDAYRNNDYKAAVENYKDALQKDPTNNIARFNLANALQKQNETGEAKKNYDEVIEESDVNSLRSGSNYNKAIAYSKRKGFIKCRCIFQRVPETGP